MLMILSSAPSWAQAATGLNGLYVQVGVRVGQGITRDHWFFLPDGKYLEGIPQGGLNETEWRRSCSPQADRCGTYTVSGDQITLNPMHGAALIHRLRRVPDGSLEIDGRPARHVDKFAPKATLNGTYFALDPDASSASTGGVAASTKSFAFRPDGTFSASDHRVLARAASSSRAGTYKLYGNILELTEGGITIRHVVYPVDQGDGAVRLVIDGESFKRE